MAITHRRPESPIKSHMGGFEVSTNVTARIPAWRNLVWLGVVSSIVAWAWAWFAGNGAQVLMLVVAIATVVLAYRAVAGLRIALVGLIVAGFVMFLASLYWMVWVMLPAGPTSVVELVSQSMLPMVTSVVLLLGAVTGFRHLRDA
jgi:hypothetical protein